MSEATPSREIQVDTDMVFQHREWKVQRVAWIVALVILILIALGATGSGPLSRASAQGDGGAASVDYSRFARRGASTTVRVTLEPAGQSEVQLWLDESIMEDYQVEGAAPQPDSTALSGDRVIYSFPVDPASEEVEIFLTLTPQRPGWISFDIGRVDGATLEISQLVYP